MAFVISSFAVEAFVKLRKVMSSGSRSFAGLFKYFLPGLFILAGIMIFLPFFVFLFRRWKNVLLVLSIGAICAVLLIVTVWEIKDGLKEKYPITSYFDSNGVIPIYSIIFTLILWIVVNFGSIIFGRLDKSEGFSPFVKSIISFFKSHTTILSKYVLAIIILQILYTVYFQFDIRLTVYIFTGAVVIVFTALEIYNGIKQKKERDQDSEEA